MSNPFDSPERRPPAPSAAFVSDSPRRLYQLGNELDDEFIGLPKLVSISPERRSPNIFNRSANFRESMTPKLNYTTPRAEYTNKESPKRMRHSRIVISESSNDLGLEYSSESRRILAPPQPIFSPETFARANSEADLEDTGKAGQYPEKAGQFPDEVGQYPEEVGDKKSLDYDVYQKEFDEASTYSLAYGAPSDSQKMSEYFGQSIDGNMMKNIDGNYVPGRTKTMTKRKVRLVGGKTGNLVLENRIPDELRKVLTRTESPFGEFTNMTYTACTAEPDDFVAEGFTLRTAKYGREIELVVCVTMYNEDEHSFARTMHGIMKNVAHLCSRSKLAVWGKELWKKVQVVIVADGRNKVNESVLQLLTATGCYQDNLARPFVNNKQVNAHLFEYTTQISIDENLKFKGDEKNLTPVQVLFCLKEKNQKKINSHRWLFNAFCPVLDPNVVVLLDVGTKPDNHAIYNLWKAFDKDSNVAGAAGEITAMKGKGWTNLLNPLVASQNFEYKMSNILDKPLESVFGYISVLPGALSAYRWIALQNNADGTGPLASYFKGEDLLTSHHQQNSKKNFFEANMYLAEDRILCWELVAKKGDNWVLKFVKQATGETDVPETIPEFLSQRRRWINGAFFAALYSLRHGGRIWQTDHLMMRKFWLCVEFFYQFVSLVMSFFSLSNFYLTFYFLTGSLTNHHIMGKGGFWVFTIFNYLCICVLTALFIASIGNRPQALKNVFKSLMLLLTVIALYTLIVGIYFVVRTIQEYGDGSSSTYIFVSVVVSMLATYGLYALMLVLYLDPWHIFTCSLQYFLMIPSYTCTLQIFAFCNTHDVSWGTKGDNNPKEDKSNQYIIEKNEEGDYEAVVVDYNIDEVYTETLYNIRAKRSSNKVRRPQHVYAAIDGEDYAKDVRTKVVLCWLLANLVFIMTMLQVYKPGETRRNVYLAVILWLVAALALFRAIGLMAYLLQYLVRWIVEANSKWSHRRQGYVATVPNLLN